MWFFRHVDEAQRLCPDPSNWNVFAEPEQPGSQAYEYRASTTRYDFAVEGLHSMFETRYLLACRPKAFYLVYGIPEFGRPIFRVDGKDEPQEMLILDADPFRITGPTETPNGDEELLPSYLLLLADKGFPNSGEAPKRSAQWPAYDALDEEEPA